MSVPAPAYRVLFCLLAGALLTAAGAGSPAKRIVTLAPHLTELVYTAGAGEQLVGAEAYSDYPAAAKTLPRVGDAFQVDYERLLALQPDLVLVWANGTPEPVIEQLKRMGLRVERITILSLDGIAGALRQIGALTGTSSVAEAAAHAYENDIAQFRTRRARVSPISVFYQISEKPLYTINGRHPISEIIGLCGGKNIFHDLAQLSPPVGIEAVIERDPQVILAGDGAQGDPLSLWKKWPRMRAVKQGNLYTVRADVLARSTPRVLEGARQVCRVLDEARDKRTRQTQGNAMLSLKETSAMVSRR